ncbi:DEAD/DEAH box helicase family protein [Bacteroidales bacterium AH-315-I05]|nr:DEAD/DEAH box helicase family protein [Bacteroidales bacterium AH-315-I05]
MGGYKGFAQINREAIKRLEKLRKDTMKETPDKHLENFDKAVAKKEYFKAATVLYGLYQEMLKGKHIDLLPELLTKANKPEIKKELRNLSFDIFHLVTSETFRKKLNTNLWNLIPEEYKKLTTIKPLEWEADPKDKGLVKIIKDFIKVDALRPSMAGAHFDAGGIVATDAHKLIFLNKVSKSKKGIYCVTKKCFDVTPNDQGFIDAQYPNYKAIVTESSDYVKTLSIDSIRMFCKAVIKAGMTEHYSVFEYDGKFIGFDLKFLLDCVEALARLGYDKVDFGINKPTEAMLITPVGKNQMAAQLKTPFVILMPVQINDNENVEKGTLLFDLDSQSAVTYGLKDPVSLNAGMTNISELQKRMAALKKIAVEGDKKVREEPEITTNGQSNDTIEPITEIEQENEEVESRTDSLSLLTADGWFKENPAKILGKEYETTNRFNKPVTKVRGTMDHVRQGIDISTDDVPKLHTEALEPNIKKPVEQIGSDPAAKANIEKVIQKQKEIVAKREMNKKMGVVSIGHHKETYEFEDILKEYNEGITEDEIKAWVWYKRKSGGFNDEIAILKKSNGWSKYIVPLGEVVKHLGKWIKEGIVCFYDGDYMPSVLYYAEHIYQKQSKLLQEKESILEQFGQDQYDRQWNGLEKVMPPKLSLTDPDINNRLFIKPTSSFAKEITVTKLTDGTNFRSYDYNAGEHKDDPNSLQEAFAEWLGSISKDEFEKSNDYNIRYYYLEGKLPPRHYDKEEKLRIRQNAKLEGDKLFVKFLAEAITREDQQRIEHLWNSKYNGYVEINYFKVPVAFTCSGTFKNKPLFIRPAQREGIGFMSVHGSGCIAYDVGVGKTMTAILSIANALESGMCKRPFIVVPNQTYKNWLTELQGVVKNGSVVSSGILPQYKVNDLYNLGTDYIDQLTDEDGNVKPVDEYTISVLTYEGFNRLALGDDTWNEIGDEIFGILNQGIEEKRDQTKLFEKVQEIMGKGMKGGMVNIEDLGFDYMVVDEAHAMKKSFTRVKGQVKEGGKGRNRAPYDIDSGQPSMTALRGFMVSQYILRNNNMRNVMLLTATPFTNSPLEIYSILALIGYQQLQKWGITNIREFFDTFIKTSLELVINAKLKPERKEIVLGFNNLIALQQLIFKFITYKTGEDANIQRPNKVVLPLQHKKVGDEYIPLPPEEQISTNLSFTPTQKGYMADIESYVTGKSSLLHICANKVGVEDVEDADQTKGEVLDERKLSDSEQEGARVLRSLSFGRQLALSPHLYSCNPDKEPTWEQYIETSPKLKYVMGCIQSVKQYHESKNEPVSGQVIYMNAGVHFFPMIKDYLVKKIGFDENEVGIIRSGMSSGKKEGIKERFLAGKVKIIIGSASIKEGINLQNKTSTLYDCWLDWNPTDVKQLEGRIWRYGNMFANVRIVVPLMENSIDTFIFQKLEEKTNRINEIWFRASKTNVLNLEEFDPAELKMGLVTDPHALAALILMDERERLKDKINSLTNQKSVLEEIVKARDDFNQNIDHIKQVVNGYKPRKEGTPARATETIFKIYRDYLEDDDTESTYKDETLFDTVRKANATLKRGLEQILQPRGMDLHFEHDKVVGKIDKEIEKLKQVMEDKTGEDAVKAKAEEIIKERVAKGYKTATVEQRVQEFSKMNPEMLSTYMTYENAEEMKVQDEARAKLGTALESSADSLTKIRGLLQAMKQMANLTERMNRLKQAA